MEIGASLHFQTLPPSTIKPKLRIFKERNGLCTMKSKLSTSFLPFVYMIKEA